MAVREKLILVASHAKLYGSTFSHVPGSATAGALEAPDRIQIISQNSPLTLFSLLLTALARLHDE